MAQASAFVYWSAIMVDPLYDHHDYVVFVATTKPVLKLAQTEVYATHFYASF